MPFCPCAVWFMSFVHSYRWARSLTRTILPLPSSGEVERGEEGGAEAQAGSGSGARWRTRHGLLARTDGLLQRAPAPLLAPQALVGVGRRGVIEAHGEVEQRLPPRHVAAIDDRQDGLGAGLLGNGVRLCSDLLGPARGSTSSRRHGPAPPRRGASGCARTCRRRRQPSRCPSVRPANLAPPPGS